MWHGMDWGWGIGLHMVGWWLMAALGVAAVATLIFILSRRAEGAPEKGLPALGPAPGDYVLQH